MVATVLNYSAVDVEQLRPMLEETNAGRSGFFIATGRLKYGEQVPVAPKG